MADKNNIIFKSGPIANVNTTNIIAGQLLFAIENNTGSIYLDKDGTNRIKLNADALKLVNARTINGTSFDGTSDITTTKWGTARNIYIQDSDGSNTGAAVSVNGGANATLKLPATIKASLSGNASTASLASYALKMQTYKYNSTETYGNSYSLYAQWNQQGNILNLKCDNYTVNTDTATKLATARTINGTSFDGSSNITTSYWGTARTLTIGNTGKSVNGSSNVTWTIAEIGAVNKAGDSMSGRLTIDTTIQDHDSPVQQCLVINCAAPASDVTVTDKNSPGIGFHIGQKNWGSLIMHPSGFKFINSSSDGYMPVYASTFYGNATSATKLSTPRAINGTNFDGTTAITTANWGTARNIYIQDSDGSHTGAAVSVNGGANATLKLPAIIKATLNGNASTATTATYALKMQTYKIGSTTETYGTSYPLYAQWESSNVLKLKCDNNIVKTDTATYLSYDDTFNFGRNSLQYFNISGSAGNTFKVNDTPSSAWWHIMRCTHSNSTGYYTDLAIPFNDIGLHYKRISNGVVQNGGWIKVLDTLNYTSVLDSRYLKLSGGTLTGALNFANGTWNSMGDDAYIGDCNQAGCIGIKGINGNTGIYFSPFSTGTTAQSITINGSGTMTITGTVASSFSGNLNGNASTASRLGTATIGSSTKPIYLNAGTPTAFSTTVGNSLTPVYMNAGTITQGETFGNRVYDYNNARIYYYSFGGGQNKNWKKIFAASHSSATPASADYRGCTVKGTIYHFTGNYNQSEVLEYPFQVYMNFYGGTSVVNSCTLRVAAGCPDSIIRVVRVTTNSFELQVRQPEDWQRIAVQFSYSGNATTQQAFSPVDATNTSTITFSRLTTSKYISDSVNGTPITITYARAGYSSASWFAAWNGYELGPISSTNARNAMSAMAAINANGFYGIGTPNGTTNTWIRTTTLGIIPYQSGGYSALGTSSWPFDNAHINTTYGNLSGNASTATALTTSAGSPAQAIYFSGGKPVAIDWHIGNANVGEHNCNNITYNMIGYYTSNGPTTSLGATTSDGSIYSQAYSSSWVSQIAQDYRDGALFVRGKNNGTWTNWLAILDSSNYTSYTVTKTGSGASGTWGINISGSANSALYLRPGGEGSTASVRTQGSGIALITGGWASTSAGYSHQYGTTLDVSGYSTWYHRLAFNTTGIIEYWQGINTTTLSKVGYLYTSQNIIYSATEPTAPHIGAIWLCPV